MAYPNIAAGQRVTASLLNSMMPVHVRKPADTSRTSTITETDDPDLKCALDANAIYRVEVYLHYACGAGGLSVIWSVPSGASGLKTATGYYGTAATSPSGAADIPAGTSRWGVHGFTTMTNYSGRTTIANQALALETAEIQTTSAGLLTIQWAQTTSSTDVTRVASRSYMRVWRLA